MQLRYLIAVSPIAAKLAGLRDRLNALPSGSVENLTDEAVLWTVAGDRMWSERTSCVSVIGDVFAKDDLSGTGGKPAQAAGAARLETLVSAYWGAYVAFEGPRADGSVRVLRAPMGALPAYYVCSDDLIAIASDVDLLRELGLIRGGLDWSELSKFFISARVVSQQTCVADVQELPPGCALTIDAWFDVQVRPMWSFWDHLRGDDRPSGRVAEGMVREAVSGAVGQMMSRAGTVAVSLSGGLDSSIVASCSTGVGRHAVLVTFAADDPDGDERQFARAVATNLGVDLLEVPFEQENVNLFVSSSRHLPRPTGNAQTQSVVGRYIAVARELGVSAIMNGMGGDNVFCTNSSALPLVDALLGRASVAEFRETLQSLQLLTGASRARIISQMLRIAARGRSPSRKPSLAHFLSSDLAQSAIDPLSAEWLGRHGKCLPGKTYHIEMIVQALHAVEGFDRQLAPTWLSPLMSQPVVEACLSVPTWMWTSGGMNRAVARRAFSDRLPPSVTYRRTKGGPDSFLRDFALARRILLREILMDGELVRRGIVDQQRLEAAFADGSMLRDGFHGQLLQLADIEAWIAYWGDLTVSADESVPVV